jgi:hypothetical protein
MPPSAATSQ